jgi:hypothetical protein
MTTVQYPAPAGAVREIRQAVLQAVSISGVAIIVGSTAALDHGQLILPDAGNLSVGVIDEKAADGEAEGLQTDFRASEMAWLAAHETDLIHEYAGRWIAIEGQAVVANAGDLATLLQMSNQAGYPHPFVTRITTEPRVPFFG